MFESTCEILGQAHRYTITLDGRALSYGRTIELLQHTAEYRSYLLSVLSGFGFAAYLWETPPVTESSTDQPFEFVLIDAPYLMGAPDRRTFAAHFQTAGPGESIVVFENLGGDATLVAPCPGNDETDFSHLGAFIRNAPDTQKHALLRVMGQTVEASLRQQPLWLSTAGGGIAWLHVRLDSAPKYYRHRPYRTGR